MTSKYKNHQNQKRYASNHSVPVITLAGRIVARSRVNVGLQVLNIGHNDAHRR